MQLKTNPFISKKMAATIAVVIVTVVAVMGIEALSSKKATPTAVTSTPVTASDTPSATSTNNPASSSTSTADKSYKDGTYITTASYDSPGGEESIQVSLTLQNDIVTNSSVQAEATDRDSREFQDIFIQGYKPYVVGKDIRSLHLNRISGASLTTEGFNNALTQIKSQAQA